MGSAMTTGGALIPTPSLERVRTVAGLPSRRGRSLLLGDVEDVAVRRPDEEAAHAPGFGGERVDDLVSAPPGLVQRGLDVVDLEGGDRVLRGGRVAGEELDAHARVRRREP